MERRERKNKAMFEDARMVGKDWVFLMAKSTHVKLN